MLLQVDEPPEVCMARYEKEQWKGTLLAAVTRCNEFKPSDFVRRDRELGPWSNRSPVCSGPYQDA